MEKKSKLTGKALLQFIVLCVGATTIYLPVFARASYYDAFVEGLDVYKRQEYGCGSGANTLCLLGRK